MLETKRNETKRNETKRNGYDFILDWLNSEGLFIFWMFILGITASKVTYSFMLRSFHDFTTEFLILLCDIAVVFINVVILSFVIYCLFRKTKTFLKVIKFILLMVGVCMFIADLFTLYYWKLPVNNIMLDFVMMTSMRETCEFLDVYLLDSGLWFFFLAVAVILFILFRIFFFMFNRKN